MVLYLMLGNKVLGKIVHFLHFSSFDYYMFLFICQL